MSSHHSTPETAILQYTLLAKNAKGKAAAQLVMQAIKNPNTFLFGELLQMSNIAELANHEETKKEFELLCLFAYGTYQDFKDRREYFESIIGSEADRHGIIQKLKQLTVVSMSSKQRVLPYARLQSELDIGNVRELEDLLIDSMYQELLKGKLDQREKYFEVYESIGRDIRKEDIDGMINVLKRWSEHSDQVLKNLEQNTQNALSEFEARKQYALSQNKMQEDITKTLKTSFDMSDMDMMPQGSERDFGESRQKRAGPSRGKRR